MVSAYLALGTELQIGDGATPTEAFDTIPGVGSISGPGATRDTVDTTSHSSTGGFREYISGLRDGGEVTATVNWLFDDTAQLQLQDAFDADEPVNFRIRYPFTSPVVFQEFAGLVTDLSAESPIDAQHTRSLTIKITGPVTEDTEP